MDSIDPAKYHDKLPKEERTKRYGAMRDYLKANAASVYRHSSSWCLAHRGQCLVQPPMSVAQEDGRRPTHGNIAGSTCRGWSTRGLEQGDADPSARPFWIWGMEKQIVSDDWVFHECTMRHQKANLRTCFPAKYRLFFLKSDPKDLGCPVRRPRMYCSAMNQETLVWTGPEDEEEL